jgi:c-di-GMP-binding flagellar brake protein YcgR
MKKANQNKEEIRAIIQKACARQGMLIFVTPNSRFESNFVHSAGQEVHARVSMGKGNELYTLKDTDIKIRFPNKFSFLEAPVKIIGFGQHEGIKTLVFELPNTLNENDDRKAFRVERVGNVIATISTTENETISTSLLDISTTGAKLSARGQAQDALKVNDKITLTIPILGVATINSTAIIRHMNTNAFGVEYVPKLTASILDPLSSWVFKKQEDAKGRTDPTDKAEAASATGKLSRKPDEGGVLVVTKDDEIEGTLRKLLSESIDFYRAEPSIATMKMMLPKRPHLVMLHLAANNMEKRRLLKSLAAMVPRDVPILLLGTGIESSVLFELGKELKVAASIAWTKERGILVERLVLGILKKHYRLGENPQAPIDAGP